MLVLHFPKQERGFPHCICEKKTGYFFGGQTLLLEHRVKLAKCTEHGVKLLIAELCAEHRVKFQNA